MIPSSPLAPLQCASRRARGRPGMYLSPWVKEKGRWWMPWGATPWRRTLDVESSRVRLFGLHRQCRSGDGRASGCTGCRPPFNSSPLPDGEETLFLARRAEPCSLEARIDASHPGIEARYVCNAWVGGAGLGSHPSLPLDRGRQYRVVLFVGTIDPPVSLSSAYPRFVCLSR